MEMHEELVGWEEGEGEPKDGKWEERIVGGSKLER